jgi:hypothetical protein
MSRLKILLFVLLPIILFSGCIQVNTKVNLNKDGSGTIEETFLMKSSVVNMMKEFVLTFDSTKTDEFNMFNENELKDKASNYGEGVKYKSGEKFSVEGYEGYKVFYSFSDINKVIINPSPEDKVPFGDDLESGEKKSAQETLKFEFKKGNPSTLVIKFPHERNKNEKTAEVDDSTSKYQDSTFNSDALQKLVDMFEGMKLSLSLNVQDKIKGSDASYVDGSTISLMSIDFSEIIKHKEILEELQKNKPESMEEFKEIVGALPGIKIELKEKVTIKF